MRAASLCFLYFTLGSNCNIVALFQFIYDFLKTMQSDFGLFTNAVLNYSCLFLLYLGNEGEAYEICLSLWLSVCLCVLH
jgi:hypothetical protein